MSFDNINKKKKILFVMPTIACGGAEKALIELLKAINKKEYDIDLLLFRKDDMFYLNEIPKEVTILENSDLMKMCFYHVKHLLKNKLILKKLNIFFLRLYLTTIMKLRKILRKKNYFYQWDMLSKHVPVLKKEYDISIGYLEGDANFYIIDKVKSGIKIGWMHTDYIKGGFSKSHDLRYFEQLTKIFCVSNLNAVNLKKVFPELINKIDVMYNLINVDEYLIKANEHLEWDNNFTGKKILSVGNLRFVKGYDLAIRVCYKLIKEGYDVKWYVAGEGKERKQLESLIKKYGLETNFILMGLCKNPYFFIKNADIFVQCSRHEGFSTTVTEAKIFAKPIVVTNCPGMCDQIESGKNGIVVSINEDSIYKAIKKMLDNPQMRNQFSASLLKEKVVTSKEIQLKNFYNSLM